MSEDYWAALLLQGASGQVWLRPEKADREGRAAWCSLKGSVTDCTDDRLIPHNRGGVVSWYFSAV